MVLQFHNISKSYGKTRALIDFSAQLTPGVYALLGPNGSGKTTLMNILTGNLKADAGNITFVEGQGQPENITAMGKRFRKLLGFMPQYPGMYGNFTLEEFLQYVATLKNVGEELPGQQRNELIRSQIDGVLQAVELSDVAHRRIRTLSGGMKQRLALAQAVLGDPKILILDEPTAGLDPKQRIAVRNYISRISQDKIVIIATHMVSDVEFIAREAIMLKKGVILDSGSPYELTHKIEGQVWQTVVRPEDVKAMQEKFRVVNIQNCEQGAILRILSDAKPTKDSVSVVPSLEDYYLHVFGDVL